MHASVNNSHTTLNSQGLLVSWHCYVDKCPFLCVFLHHSDIWSVVLQHLVSVHNGTICWYTPSHTFYITPGVWTAMLC